MSTTTNLRRPLGSWQNDMTVTVPEGVHGNVAVERFTIEGGELENWRLGSRSIKPGTYTRLMRNDYLWMSDTPAEKRDHLDAYRAIERLEARRIVIGGLGLGMIVQAALTFDHVEHIDVIEIDPDVVALVGPHYEATGRVTIHEADVFEMKWKPGTTWDVAWWDVWPDLCTDNLDEMARLHRSYGRRVKWQGSWGKEILLVQREREKKMWWYR